MDSIGHTLWESNMPQYLNPYTQQLEEQPIDYGLPQRAVASPSTVQALTPQNGSVLAPLLQFSVGMQQLGAENQALDFKRQQVMNQRLKEKARTRATVNWLQRAAQNPNSRQFKFLKEVYGDPQSLIEMTQAGAIDPSKLYDAYARWSQNYTTRARDLAATTKMLNEWKNTPFWKALGMDKVAVNELVQSPAGRQYLQHYIDKMRNMQASLLDAQKQGKVLRVNGQLYRIGLNRQLIPFKGKADESQIVDFEDLIQGVTAPQLVNFVVQKDADGNLIIPEETLDTKQNVAALLAHRHDPEVQQAALYAVQRVAKEHGVELDPSAALDMMDRAMHNSKGEVSLNDLANRVFALMTTSTGEGRAPLATGLKVFNEQGQPIKIFENGSITPEAEKILIGYAAANGINPTNLIKALQGPHGERVARVIQRWQQKHEPSVFESAFVGTPEQRRAIRAAFEHALQQIGLGSGKVQQ